MQEKNPNQRQTTQGNPRREEGQRHSGTAVREEEGWRGESGQLEQGRTEGEREGRSRGFYADALRRRRERPMGRAGFRPFFEERHAGYGPTGYTAGYYEEPEFGRAGRGTEPSERWGGRQLEDWRAQQTGTTSGFPQQGYGQRWSEEGAGGYGERSWDRQARLQDWKQRDREFGQQQDWRQHEREQGMQGFGEERGRTRRQGRLMRHGEVEHSRWGGWDVPFLGGGGQQRTHWNREPYTVRDIMTRDPQSVKPHNTLRDAARLMKDEHVGILPVVDEERRLRGIITDRDLVVRALAEDRPVTQSRTEELMTREVEAITEDEEIREVLHLMGRKQVRRLPVVDEQDRLIGMVSISDIAQKADFDEELQEALEQISARRSFWSRLWM